MLNTDGVDDLAVVEVWFIGFGFLHRFYLHSAVPVPDQQRNIFFEPLHPTDGFVLQMFVFTAEFMLFK